MTFIGSGTDREGAVGGRDRMARDPTGGSGRCEGWVAEASILAFGEGSALTVETLCEQRTRNYCTQLACVNLLLYVAGMFGRLACSISVRCVCLLVVVCIAIGVDGQVVIDREVGVAVSSLLDLRPFLSITTSEQVVNGAIVQSGFLEYDRDEVGVTELGDYHLSVNGEPHRLKITYGDKTPDGMILLGAVDGRANHAYISVNGDEISRGEIIVEDVKYEVVGDRVLAMGLGERSIGAVNGTKDECGMVEGIDDQDFGEGHLREKYKQRSEKYDKDCPAVIDVLYIAPARLHQNIRINSGNQHGF